jgi:hypothetical protein
MVLAESLSWAFTVQQCALLFDDGAMTDKALH